MVSTTAQISRKTSQKQALKRAIKLAQLPYQNDPAQMHAAGVMFAILWLEDMNWHWEAAALDLKAAGAASLKGKFSKIRRNVPETNRLTRLAQKLNAKFGWSVHSDEWQAAYGPNLVEELWVRTNSKLTVLCK